MNTIYRVTIQGRTFESKDLRRLLARAVTEKRSLDQRLRITGGRCPGFPSSALAMRGYGVDGGAAVEA
jgi:hypothetical protein